MVRNTEPHEALIDLAAIARNVRFDLTRTDRRRKSELIDEQYVQELGMRLLEVINDHFDVRPRDWDRTIDALNMTHTARTDHKTLGLASSLEAEA